MEGALAWLDGRTSTCDLSCSYFVLGTPVVSRPEFVVDGPGQLSHGSCACESCFSGTWAHKRPSSSAPSAGLQEGRPSSSAALVALDD